MNNDYIISVSYCRKPVRHYDAGSASWELEYAFLYHPFAFSINIWCRLVKHKHSRVKSYGSRKWNELPLSCRHRAAPLFDFFIKTIRQTIDKDVRSYPVRRLPYVKVAYAVVFKPDIGFDVAWKKKYILKHNGNLPS